MNSIEVGVTGPTQRIASLVANTKSFSPEVLQIGKTLIMDTIGVAIAGSSQEGGRIIVEFAKRMGGGPQATIFGTNARTSPYLAALTNGTNAAILDYDDTSLSAIAHLSGSIVSATAAIAEARNLSGLAMLEAYVVGYEAATKVAPALQPEMYLGGRHTTGTLGVIASTAACARLLGLDATKTATAFGIAASLAGAVRANFGTMTKGLHTGWAASDGVLAASLASNEFTACSNIIEAKYGFAFNLVKSHERCRLDEVGKNWADPWDLVNPGVGIKFQPSGTMAFCPTECAIELASRHDIDPEAIVSVECKTTQYSLDFGRYFIPETSAEAMYSTPWCIAVGLSDRQAGLAQFSMQRVQDPKVRSLAAKVQMSVHPDLKSNTDVFDISASEVSVTLSDGRKFKHFRSRPRGYPGGEPWTEEMVRDKFRNTAGVSLNKIQLEKSISLLSNLERLADFGELATYLRNANARAS